MATKPRIPNPDTFSIDSKQRKANPWVDDLAKDLKAEALGAKRAEARKGGPKLPVVDLNKLLDEYEEEQRKINQAGTRQEEIAEELKAHWGHTGVEEIEHRLGNTSFTLSYSLAGLSEKLKSGISEREGIKITKPIPQAALLLGLAATDPSVRKALAKALTVKELKLTIKAPSSRTEKSVAPKR